MIIGDNSLKINKFCEIVYTMMQLEQTYYRFGDNVSGLIYKIMSNTNLGNINTSIKSDLEGILDSIKLWYKTFGDNSNLIRFTMDIETNENESVKFENLIKEFIEICVGELFIESENLSMDDFSYTLYFIKKFDGSNELVYTHLDGNQSSLFIRDPFNSVLEGLMTLSVILVSYLITDLELMLGDIDG